MQLIINSLIFCIVLFLYIHIYNHIKTSNYLEVYEIENLSKDKLEDIINFKQPLLLNNYTLINNIDANYLISNYPTFDLNLYNTQNDLFLKIKLDEFNAMVNNDSSNNYISYNNTDFLEETTLEKILSSNDTFFRPYNVCSKNYDIIMGTKNSTSRLKYSINSRNILYKVKFLRVLLNSDQVLIIPPYWFYSIKFLEENTIVFFNSYRTFTSSIAILPELFTQLLQQHNLKLNIIKKIDGNNENIKTENIKTENIIT